MILTAIASVALTMPIDVPVTYQMTIDTCHTMPYYLDALDCIRESWDERDGSVPLCPSEEWHDCIHLSREGQSFVDVDGTAYYLGFRMKLIDA